MLAQTCDLAILQNSFRVESQIKQCCPCWTLFPVWHPTLLLHYLLEDGWSGRLLLIQVLGQMFTCWPVPLILPGGQEKGWEAKKDVPCQALGLAGRLVPEPCPATGSRRRVAGRLRPCLGRRHLRPGCSRRCRHLFRQPRVPFLQQSDIPDDTSSNGLVAEILISKIRRL
jgi:hypothetical protein